MNGATLTQCSSAVLHKRPSNKLAVNGVNGDSYYRAAAKGAVKVISGKKMGGGASGNGRASFLSWTLQDAVHVARHHWIPCVFAMGLLFFMGVEYTLRMVPASSPPFDLGFIATRPLHRLLSSSPQLNTLFAALNTVPFSSFTSHAIFSSLLLIYYHYLFIFWF